MKNFEDLLKQKQPLHPHHHLVPTMGQLKQQTSLDKLKSIALKFLVPVSLSLITGPFTTVSTLLQITNKPIFNPITTKLKLTQPSDPIYKHIKNGIFGDSKPYKAFEFKSYSDALKQMGKQGFKGIYKGNLTGIIFMGFNSKLRTQLYSKGTDLILTQQQKLERNFIKENLITITTCTIADLITLPLMFCQSRLILQNSLANFRQYKSPIDILKRVSLKNLYTGGGLLVVKNGLFSLAWLQLINDSPVYSFVLSSVLSHIFTYPFVTIIRQMQTNAPGVAMMNDRKENIREVIQRIWSANKIQGFYRGFIGYGIVHFFMGIIMLQQNIRTGYFQQIQ